MSLKYLFRVITGMSLKKLNGAINYVHEKTGRNRVHIFLDMVWCAIRYGAGYHDYLFFAFYDRSASQRATFLTRIKNKKAVEALNDPRYAYIFDNKNIFDRYFSRFLHRGFLDLSTCTKEDFADFIKGKEYVIVKPNDLECGKGIEKIRTADFPDAESLWAYVKNPEKRLGVVEDLLIQHEDMARLYPFSVNTLRVVTVLDTDDTVHFAFIGCKMGNNGKFVDNVENGGLFCLVDMQTHCLIRPAQALNLTTFDVHPYTGVKLAGYHIPYIKEVMALCTEAAHVVPQMRYIGWDVAICQDGPALVEGNNYSAHDLGQYPEQSQDKTGLLPFFRQFVPGL